MENVIDILSERIGPMERGQNWIPFANILKDKMRTHGKYANGYPRGAIIHYTAGQQDKGVGALNWGREQGYCFLLIDSVGVIHQAHPINEWGYHAGKSSYVGLNGTVSDDLIGIEIACAGKLEKVSTNEGVKFKAWFHKQTSQYFDEDEVRFSKSVDNIQEGYYQKYTPAQEKSLTNLLLWLKDNDPVNRFSFDFVLGHDSVSPGRKTDPGASLSMSIPDYQKYLKTLHLQNNKNIG
jgi:N-acetyl-anhydromuramyl-L-alanine amidase AmpD